MYQISVSAELTEKCPYLALMCFCFKRSYVSKEKSLQTQKISDIIQHPCLENMLLLGVKQRASFAEKNSFESFPAKVDGSKESNF